MYRYGFEVTKEKVLAEWLYQRPKTKEVELFYREEQDFEIHPTKFKVQDLIDKDRIKPNTLLLTKADAENEKIAKKVFEWFNNNFNLLSGLQEHGYLGYSTHQLNDKIIKQQIINLLKSADLGIEDLKPQLVSIDDLPENLPKALREKLEKEIQENKAKIFGDTFTFHKKYDSQNLHIGMEQFSMDDDESSGTQKYFALSAPILETLKQGEVLIIDELDAKLHPNLVYKIVEIFNSKEKNPRNAQLIFNTHDTNLLSCGLFRRDQIWFTEKDRYGASILYSLADFKTDKVRKDDNFAKNYIEGKYGAIPYLGDFDKLLNL
jgi:AAA15 family ATPase/GTPase